MGNFARVRVYFYRVVGTWGVILIIWIFLKLKATFCKYWTSVKIKLTWPVRTKNMNINKSGTGAMTTAKSLLAYNIKSVVN